MRLVNASGQEVLVRSKATVHNGKLQMQVGRLAPGVYQVVVSEDGNVHQFRVFRP